MIATHLYGHLGNLQAIAVVRMLRVGGREPELRGAVALDGGGVLWRRCGEFQGGDRVLLVVIAAEVEATELAVDGEEVHLRQGRRPLEPPGRRLLPAALLHLLWLSMIQTLSHFSFCFQPHCHNHSTLHFVEFVDI